MSDIKALKMDIKSPLATKLKSSISLKLLDFFENENFSASDDVLSEYITVLVCNGKDRNQAKEDLEAFLGERSAEFVAWLWDLLSESEYASQHNMTTGLSLSKDVPVTNSHDMEIVEGIHQHPAYSASFDELNTKEASLQPYKRKLPKELGPNLNTCDDFQTYKSPVMGDPSMTQPREDQSIRCSDTTKKVVEIRGNGFPNQLLSSPKREPQYRDMQSSHLEIPRPRQSSAVNVSGRSLPPRSVDAASKQIDKSRRSVWDRLGKPCGTTLGKVNPVYAHGVNRQDEEILEKRSILGLIRSDECKRSSIEPCRFGKRALDERTLLEHNASKMCPIQVANNIGRKRHFVKISTDADTSSVSLVCENDDAHTKANFQDPKIAALTTQVSKDIAPNFVSGCSSMANKAESIKDETTVITPVQSQVLDVKLRLRQIEMEMSKLRQKQAEMKKDGKSMSSLGAEKTIEARTVLVTNVHFAATKEDLVSYFAKCGSISNVVILTDLVTAQPKGLAYITFASEDSVDKAVELSGTSFFSRIVKVRRKAEAAAIISDQGQVAKKPAQVQSYFSRMAVSESPYTSNSHLKWCRETVSVRCETSNTTITEEKSVATPASM